MIRHQAPAFAISAIGVMTAFGLVTLSGCYLNLATLLPWLGFLALLIGLHVLYATKRPSPVVASLLGTLTVTISALLASGIIALAGLRLRAGLIDPVLARTDAALGIDVRVLTAWLADCGWLITLLTVAYQSSVPLVFVTVLGLSLMRRHEEAWRYSLHIAAAGLACALCSVFVPAIGAVATLGISAETLSRLSLAGDYHLPVFRAFYEGGARMIDVAHLEGVVTFPSFHTTMALATAQAWATNRWLRASSAIWTGIVLISTIPIGGHYLIDVLAGAALFAVIACLSRARPASGGVDASLVSLKFES